ncbi:hypothetical protein [Timonella senegalensis]|uniref:hypothetical protein n=1 Tax=Timonella senegalensis TaxID=1465825 RepID=UPI0028A5D563|nr:hypothetical protein [Timonella senegalensis]
MAAEYSLQPNEVVLFKDEQVSHGGPWATYTHELMLTNLHIVLTKKGLVGRVKEVQVWSLDQIKVHEQRAQVMSGKAAQGTDALEIYFQNGKEKFGFSSDARKRVNQWISQINQAVTGIELDVPHEKGISIPGSEMLSGMLNDAFSMFKPKRELKAKQTLTISSKCQNCGAPVSGAQGQALVCTYCGSTQ